MISQLLQDVVQGPIEHPRFGKTVLIHPTLETARAGVFPTQAVIVTSAARCLIAANRDGERIKSVVVEGVDHDPTRHPEFNEISRNLRELLNKHFPKAKLHLLCDAPQLEEAQARHALIYYDHPTLRLETGTLKTFTALTGEPSQVFKDRLEGIERLELEKLVIQANFVRGKPDNSTATEVKAWLKHIQSIRPASIVVSSIPSPEAKGQKAITKTRMNEIVDLITEKTGIPVERLD